MSQSIYKFNCMYEYFKYSLVGIINLFFTVFLFWLSLKVFSISYTISFSISWFFGVVLTFFINANWVFKSDKVRWLKKFFLKYFIVYLSSYFINLFLLEVAVRWLFFDPFLSQFIIIPIVVLGNYYGIKYWALKQK